MGKDSHIPPLHLGRGCFGSYKGEVYLCWIIDPRGRLNDKMMCNLITDEVIIPNWLMTFLGVFSYIYI